MALTEKLTAIADAIREKGGTTEKLTLEAMAAAITALEVGSGGFEVPTLTGAFNYRFSNNGWNWLIEELGSKINTENINDMSSAFESSYELTGIPFSLNTIQNEYVSWNNAFNGCSNLKSISKITNFNPNNVYQMFSNCYSLRYLPEMDNIDVEHSHWARNVGVFSDCNSLRSIPEALLNELYFTNGTGANYSFLYNTFQNCYVLDEIIGLMPKSDEYTSNAFAYTFTNCHRLKNLIFATKDGKPYSVSWKNQTISLYDGIGWLTQYDSFIINNNSGITDAKKVSDGASYEALKNDADWYTGMPEYSRFNHDSAVAMINSLPDTSTYLATNGGTNTIKLRNGAGANTDGGSCGSLTEEEIAVATSKGWTITYEI